VKAEVDAVLKELSPLFDEMYSGSGRPLIPPERLLKAMVLMALYSVKSERQFCEELHYNMLYLWFLDMQLDEKAFSATSFTKNRARFEAHDVARRFFSTVVDRARNRGLLSSEEFSVDGTLIEAWGSIKSFRPKEEEGYDSKGFPNFRGEKRRNDTHESKTDPDARLYRKGPGREAKLSHMAHVLVEHRNGLVVDVEVTEASGTAEREAALRMLERETKRRKSRKRQRQARKTTRKRRRRATVAADKAYDNKSFVAGARALGLTPHVAQKARYSAIDGRTTRHKSYAVSTTKRLLTEKPFGWYKTQAGGRRSRFKGRKRTADSALMGIATLNILRVSKLRQAA
jgi:transposase